MYELLVYKFLMDHFFAEAPSPLDAILSINHAILVNGTSNFPIEPSFGVETSELYPDVKYTTVEEFLHQFV